MPSIPWVAVVVGLPLTLRAPLERDIDDRAKLCVIPMKQDGGLMLQPPPAVAARMLEDFAIAAEDHDQSYPKLILVLLPYARIPADVTETAEVLRSMGATLLKPSPGADGWPSRPPRLDQKFQLELKNAIANELLARLPQPAALSDGEEEVAEELVRGLASHAKMGENNHSSEDDLWKSRGQDLGPGERKRIVAALLSENILGRKKNKSKGGTGWVYWIADVGKARGRFPTLAAYFN